MVWRKKGAGVGSWVLILSSVATQHAVAQEGGSDLAKQLANPLAALISVPLQANYDENIGPAEDGERWLVNIQPVIPVSLSQDWNLISRTILPVISQDDVFLGAGSQSGIGDVVQSIFFSPKAPTASGWIWGVGPVLLLPTGMRPTSSPSSLTSPRPRRPSGSTPSRPTTGRRASGPFPSTSRSARC